MRKGFFQQQAERALAQNRYALLLATILAAVPYMNWLALALMGLVTLRHGFKAGLEICLPVTLMHVLVFVFSMPLQNAVLMGLLNVLPCFGAAYVLKQTTSWRMVAVALLLFVAVGALLVQAFSPDFVTAQYAHLETLIKQLAKDKTNVFAFWGERGISSLTLAHYFLGIQAASLVFSAVMPLLFSRALQSQLFYPGGFRQEMLHFKGKKTDFGVLLALLALAYMNQFLAIDCLPLLLFYFILSGLSVSAYTLSHMRPLVLMLLLVAPMLFLSWVFLPLYALFGALDSLFNFRLYLSEKTGQAT